MTIYKCLCALAFIGVIGLFVIAISPYANFSNSAESDISEKSSDRKPMFATDCTGKSMAVAQSEKECLADGKSDGICYTWAVNKHCMVVKL